MSTGQSKKTTSSLLLIGLKYIMKNQYLKIKFKFAS